MFKRGIVAIALMGLAIAFGGTTAKAEDTIKVGFSPEPYPPFYSKDAAGNWGGFEVDLLNALCDEMKAKCVLTPVAWDGIIPALTEKKIDMIFNSMSITDDRKKVIDFSDKYYNTPAVFIGAKNDDIKIDVNKPDSLKGKIVGVQTATIHANYVQEKFGKTAEIKLYDTQDNANADLVAGRVDVLLADSIALDAFLKSDQGKDYEVKYVAPDDPIFGDGVGAGLRKGDTALKEKINAAIKAIRANGTYDKIAKKYFDFNVYGS
ncbi:MAG: transporter substrate-binding domain-containing protein [Rhodospirillaceae bacterium]|nr:MAG: transporter substrate-binding domain-containing protein [Rhodospirillaceae bacterium]